ncbi:MAG: site-specific integrase [Salinibacterium sp.]|nr:site-specific integrase [Salinibacterium sp.]
MPRPPLAVGSWGKISRTQVEPKKWRARARFRDFTGKTSQVEAWGVSGAAAQRSLEAALRVRIASGGEDVTPDMRLAKLGKLWLAEIELSNLSPQTVERYRTIFERTIVPGLGGIMVREASVSTIDRFLKATAARTPAIARSAKVVLSGMLGMATRHDALRTNPVREVASTRSAPKEVRALSVDDVAALRRGVRLWLEDPAQIGQRRSADIPDVVDLLLATGARIGELCALRWSDVDLSTERPTVTIAGTIVRLQGKGVARQPHPKSAAGFRTVTLPRFAVETLLRRQVNATPNPLDLVFPSQKGSIREPGNLRRQWRDARAAAGFDWVVPHTFRKTVATLIDQERSTANAASQLGHSSQGLTASRYVQKAAIAPDVSDVLEAFASRDPSESKGSKTVSKRGV